MLVPGKIRTPHDRNHYEDIFPRESRVRKLLSPGLKMWLGLIMLTTKVINDTGNFF